MEVYVLTIVWQRDSGDFGSDTKVFSSFERAQQEMEIQMESARFDFDDLDTEEDDYVEGDMSWSIWESGEYAYNHCDITIKQCEVE